MRIKHPQIGSEVMGADKPLLLRVRCCQRLGAMGARAREALPSLRYALGEDSQLLRAEVGAAIRKIEASNSDEAREK